MICAKLDNINPNEVLMYLGYRSGEVPLELEQQIADCSAQIYKTAQPRVTYRIFSVGQGKLQNTEFKLQGQDILRHLENCSKAILMAATLGPGVETLLMRAQIQDMATALILDSCASTAIENICDNLEAELRTKTEAEGNFLTDRFSPGYGDMPIDQQREFCALLDTLRRIGLTVSQSGILLPRKSVTAVMGISDRPVIRRSYGCANCNMFRNCQIRKNGHHCGK